MSKEVNLTFQKRARWHTTTIAIAALGLDHNQNKKGAGSIKELYFPYLRILKFL